MACPASLVVETMSYRLQCTAQTSWLVDAEVNFTDRSEGLKTMTRHYTQLQMHPSL